MTVINHPFGTKYNPCRYGVNQVGYGSARDLSVLSQMQNMGCTAMRIAWDWNELNPSNGTQFWGGPDAIVAACKLGGIVPVFCLYNSPQWASGYANIKAIPVAGSGADTTWRAAYATFAASFATRYGTDVILEIWNEPNTNYSGSFWQQDNTTNTLPNVTQYINLYNAAYTAIKAVNPKILVSTAGLSALNYWGDAFGTAGVTYLGSMMSAGIKADMISIHPYTTGGSLDPTTPSTAGQNNFKDIGVIQTAMIAANYGYVPLRIGEFGNYSAAACGSEAIKATYVSAAFGLVESTYSIRVVGPQKAGVIMCTYFANNNATNGTTDTTDIGLWTGTPLVGPNTILASGIAFRTFMSTLY